VKKDEFSMGMSRKRLPVVAALPIIAALTLPACGSQTEHDASEVNIEPVETEVPTPDVEPTPPVIEENDDATPTGATETTFTQTENGVELTLTYTSVGDRVIKQTTTSLIDYAAAGLGDKAEAQALLDPLVEQSDDIEGYEQSIEYGETSAVEKVSIDYEVADINELHDVPGFEGSGDLGRADYISLEESRKLLKENGFTEVD